MTGYLNHFARFVNSRLVKGRPPNLICYLTSRCQSNCKTCYYHDNLNRTDAAELTLDEWRKIADKNRFIVNLSLSGGEPFLRDEIAEITLAFAEKNSLHTIGITSNALLPETTYVKVKKMLEKLPKRTRLELALSLDGLFEQHDFIRGVPGNFEKLLETVSRLQAFRKDPRRFVLKTCTVLCRSNIENIGEIIKFAQDGLKIDRAHIQIPHGKSRIPGELDVDADICERVLRDAADFEIQRQPDFIGKTMAAFQQRAGEIQAKIKKGETVFNCRVLDSVAIIAEDGSIYSCEPLRHKVADIREHDYSLKSALNSNAAKQFRNEIRTECNCVWYAGVLASLITDPAELAKIALTASRSP
ncbi:MAG: heme b synthase [Myxococcota bacterium]